MLYTTKGHCSLAKILHGHVNNCIRQLSRKLIQITADCVDLVNSKWKCNALGGFLIKLLGIRMRIFATRQCADYARASYAGASEARVARL